MPKYLCIQRSAPQSQPGNSQRPSPSEMQAMYLKFNEWREKFSDKLVDMGGKLGAGKIAQSEADGPFVETKELIGGYMIVSAQTLDEAVEIARACPGLVHPGSAVEVREIHTP